MFEHPAFDNRGHPAGYGRCNARIKIDYILLSPKVNQLVQANSFMPQGMWPGVRPKR